MTSKFVHFAEFFFNDVITSELNFVQISGIFPTCLRCFLLANTTNKIFLDDRNVTKLFSFNIPKVPCSS